MHPIRKSLVFISITGVLTGSALAALADTGTGKPFDGVVVEDIVAVEQFPREVRAGSVAVSDFGASVLSAARLTSGQAADIAARALPGKVVATRLDGENGYLIWEVTVFGGQGRPLQLKIDAGNGRLLAVEKGYREHPTECDDEEDHSSWKFWERGEDDEEHHGSWKFWERGEHEDRSKRS